MMRPIGLTLNEDKDKQENKFNNICGVLHHRSVIPHTYVAHLKAWDFRCNKARSAGIDVVMADTQLS